MWLAGVPVADKVVLHLAASLREAELVDTAERLERAYDREARIVALEFATARRSSACSRTAPRSWWSCGQRCCRSTSCGSAKVSSPGWRPLVGPFMKFKPTRADRLSPEEREIVDRFQRGVIDATEAGQLLIASVHSVRQEAAASVDESGRGAEETDAASVEGPEEAKARALIERLAQEVYDDPA